VNGRKRAKRRARSGAKRRRASWSTASSERGERFGGATSDATVFGGANGDEDVRRLRVDARRIRSSADA
jgi:hypothetical protein